MNKPVHFAFIGPGGSGKSTWANRLKDDFPGLQLYDQLNHTTRKMRAEEVSSGKSDYTHITMSEYLVHKGNSNYISIREKDDGRDADGNIEQQYYGLSVPQANATIFVVDVPWYYQLLEWSRKTGEEIVWVFFSAPRDVCYQRMLSDSGETRADDRDRGYDESMAFLQQNVWSLVVVDTGLPMSEGRMQLYTQIQQVILGQTLLRD